MQLYQKVKLFLMRHKLKITILSILLSIIVFKSAISKSDNDIVDRVIKKYFSTEIADNQKLSNEFIKQKKVNKTKI